MPSPLPSPIVVQLAPDIASTIIAIVSAIIALLAAAFTAYAAVQAARAARTARDAYLNDAADRRIRQAQHVHAQIGPVLHSKDEVSATVSVQNTSDGFVFNIEVSLDLAGNELSILKKQMLSNHVSISETVHMHRDEYVRDAAAIIRYTDYAGIRWERRDGNPPAEVQSGDAAGDLPGMA